MHFLSGVINYSTNILARLRRNRKFYIPMDQVDGLVKVNLGCGLRVEKSWLNIDGSLNALFASWPRWTHRFLYHLSGSKHYYSLDQYCKILGDHKFIFHDLSLSLPLQDKSVDFIYSSHFLEHLFKDDALKLLKSCARALKPGGTIRISVPDLSYAISLYSLGRKKEMLEDFFFVLGKGSYLARHKYMYDYELIEELLQQAGFSYITHCQFRQGKVPNLEALDIYPDLSLFVEASSL